MRNAQIISVHTYTQLFSPILGVGFSESGSLDLSLYCLFPLSALVAKTYQSTSFANLDAMGVRLPRE